MSNADPEAIMEAEKLLKKYPNSFEAVHICAEVYFLFAHNDHEMLAKAQQLLERSLHLLAQSPDSECTEQTIYSEMAYVHIVAKEYEKRLELLKQHNKNGDFNDAIGSILSTYLNRPDEAEKYLSSALISHTMAIFDVVTGYVKLFDSRKDYKSAGEMIDWAIQIIQGLRKEEQQDFTSKVYIFLLLDKAYVQLKTGNREGARQMLTEISEHVRNFDVSPDYQIHTLRFTTIPEGTYMFDILGLTARESTEALIEQYDNDELLSMWKEVINE